MSNGIFHQPSLRRNVSRSRGAFSLIEVTIALGVVGFALVAIFGLIPVGINTSRAGIEQTGANDVLAAVVTDIRSTPRTSPAGLTGTTQRFSIPIPANPVATAQDSTFYFESTGSYSTFLGAHSRYRVSVTFLPNANSRAATRVLLKLTWPAAAAPANACGSVSTFTAVDRN